MPPQKFRHIPITSPTLLILLLIFVLTLGLGSNHAVVTPVTEFRISESDEQRARLTRYTLMRTLAKAKFLDSQAFTSMM